MLLNRNSFIIYNPVNLIKRDVSESGICHRPQIKPSLLGPIGGLTVTGIVFL
jgi:hypothetical protein